MLLVTDVSGPVGKAVLAELANGPAPVRALLQPGGELPVQAPNIEAAHFDPTDATSLQRAVQGVEAIFLAWQFSPQLAEAHMRIVAAAKAAGVRRLVQLSGVGADPNMCCARMLRWYGQAEVTVAAAGLEVTRLRPSMLCRTSSSLRLRSPSRASSPVRSVRPSGRGSTRATSAPLLQPRCATLAQRTHLHRNGLGIDELSANCGAYDRILGKPVRYADITANEARGWLQGKGLSPVMIEAKLEMWDACASNLIECAAEQVVKEVIGREPRTVDEFVRDYKRQFLTASAA